MSIDIKRLEVDAGYWDEVAPEGATHYDPEDMGDPWMRELESNWMFYWESKRGWVRYLQKAMLARIVARLVIRPDAQEEWTGTGRPPVGCICEAVWLEPPDGGGRDFESVHIKAYFGSQVWFESQSLDEVVCEIRDCEFRPIRTQAQRERDDLLTSIIEDYRKSLNSPVSTIELNLISEFSNYLYEIGMLRSDGE